MKWIGLVILAASILSCAPTRIVRPLKTNEQMIGLSIGGPLIQYAGATIPMPLTSIQYARGINDKTTGFASLHTTSLLYGLFQTDIGVCKEIYRNNESRFGITTTPALNIAIDRWDKHIKVWPQVDINFYWELKPEKSFIYGGLDNWFELSKYKAHNEQQSNHWLCSPQIGFNYSRSHWNFVLEGKYLLPFTSTQPNVVEYKGINGKGAIGIYLGINRKL